MLRVRSRVYQLKHSLLNSINILLMTAMSIKKRLSDELGASIGQVSAAIALLDDGATVPFIARYRKEATGGLDDTQLRLLQTHLNYLRELELRRKAIIDAINAQQKNDA